MPSLIAFDLSNSENENNRLITLAIINKTHLGNSSVITQNREIKMEPIIPAKFNKHDIPIIPYSTKEELDQYLITNHTLFLFRICHEIPNIIPLSTPIVVYGSGQAKHGNIFCDSSEWDMDISNVDTLSQQFSIRIIQPMISIIPSIAYIGTQGTAIIFTGSSYQKDLTAVRTSSMISKSEPRDRNRREISAPISSLSMLKQTLDSIISRKNDKIRVKIVCNWTNSKQLLLDWNHMIEDSHMIKNIEWISEGIPDYWVVINKPPETESIIPKQTIVFRMEPYIDNIYFYNDWLAGKKKSDFLYFLDHENHRNNTEWWLSLSSSDHSTPVQKTFLFSAVVSSQYIMKGHRLRVDFIKFFQDRSKIPLHIFGHDNSHKFRDYQGSLPLRTKDAGILPYKYHFAAENSDIPNYVTEKFFDAIIGECLLFYWGCPNIAEHIDKRAFIQLDLTNFEESLKIVETSILSNEWEKRLPIIREEKKRIMRFFNPFIRISSLISINDLKCIQVCNSNSEPQKIPGLNVYHFLPSEQVQIFHKLFRNYNNSTIPLTEIVRLVRHFALWTSCSTENKPFLIFEGKVGSNFLDHLSELWSRFNYSDNKWDIMFLESSKTIAYILSSEAAKRLITFINNYGFPNCLIEMFDSLPTFIPGWKICSGLKTLIIPEKNELPGEIFHIFRNLGDGKWSSEKLPHTMPSLDMETKLVPESRKHEFS